MMLEKIFPKVHPEGYKFLVISAVITLIIWLFSNFFDLNHARRVPMKSRKGHSGKRVDPFA